MKRIGIAVTVSDAPRIVKKTASYITAKRGGEGAVREVVDLIFKAQKLEDKVYQSLKKQRK
jgi:3-deoxy-D-manno-octulosonate 8-phosphate phosphatase (KDO 8-P phosphatase)